MYAWHKSPSSRHIYVVYFSPLLFIIMRLSVSSSSPSTSPPTESIGFLSRWKKITSTLSLSLLYSIHVSYIFMMVMMIRVCLTIMFVQLALYFNIFIWNMNISQIYMLAMSWENVLRFYDCVNGDSNSKKEVFSFT